MRDGLSTAQRLTNADTDPLCGTSAAARRQILPDMALKKVRAARFSPLLSVPNDICRGLTSLLLFKARRASSFLTRSRYGPLYLNNPTAHGRRVLADAYGTGNQPRRREHPGRRTREAGTGTPQAARAPAF